jgi:hypothetical protein
VLHLNITFAGMPKSQKPRSADSETEKNTAKQAGENNAKANQKSLEDRIDELNIDKKEQLKAKRDAGKDLEGF